MGCGGLKDANNAELAGREEFQWVWAQKQPADRILSSW
jgi:hypothetical protein